MKILNIFIFLLVILFTSCSDKMEKVTDFVDPFIGTDGHGHVYPGAAMPFGMVQLSPDTRKDNWDACAGYHYSDRTIMGFSHTHLSGTGVGDYGDIRLMPTVGEIQLTPGEEANPQSGYRSGFRHETEIASPGYYKVELDDDKVKVELTTTPRTGFHKYTFPKTVKANVILDLTEGVTSDEVLELWIDIVSTTEIQGLRRTKGWAADQYVYFNAEFSTPFQQYDISVDGSRFPSRQKASGKDIRAWFTFDTNPRQDVMIKVGISAVSAAGARNNRIKEIPGWDFEKTKADANAAWVKELGKIEISDKDNDRKTVFYTALYHALLNPNLYSDFDGRYRGHDQQIHEPEGFDMYTVFSLWDTFRAEHPLLTIIDRKRTTDFIRSMLAHYEQGGLLPVWELAANETNCMIGYHAVPVIVDAYMKGIRDFDAMKALEACVKSATQDHFGLDSYKKKGYIPWNEESESVSKTLEYAYDDWCIAQLAKQLGQQEIYKTFIKRGQFYKNLFDPETKFMRAKGNESWFTPFDPHEVNFNYTEANAWQYSFFVPQDITGLMELVGGPDSLTARLDELFSVSSATTGRQQSDITGLIGQYAHGNEPSHHMAYLYNYSGQPWKTQEIARKIMTGLYTSKPDGLCGNEDCGQMSAWYVMSAMGFYPVTPGSDIYAIGSPIFNKVTLNLENGKTFLIEAGKASTENKYIRSAKLNGNSLSRSFIRHHEIMDGGSLRFRMGQNPDKKWGTGKENMPVSAITDFQITPVPYVKTGNKIFDNEQTISFACAEPEAVIKYVILTEPGNEKFIDYSSPLLITNTASISAYAMHVKKESSQLITAEFLKIPTNRTIKLINPYANQYNAGGDRALIDLQRGETDFRTGLWQGYQGVDLEAVISFGKAEKIKKITTGFLQDVNAWIFMPVSVKYYVSDDGIKFREIGIVDNSVPEDDWTLQTRDFTVKTNPVSTRYLKVIAKNRGKCPSWHKGAGNPSWIFADEILIE